MSNMSHCRFENTAGDLEDCYKNMDETDSSEWELKARKKLINLCIDIAQDYGDELGYEASVEKM